MKYQITLAQLSQLSFLIGEMDGLNKTTNKPLADMAHDVIQEVLGSDTEKLYAPDEELQVG